MQNKYIMMRFGTARKSKFGIKNTETDEIIFISRDFFEVQDELKRLRESDETNIHDKPQLLNVN